jgi:peptidoglycan/LPS O-acetylase OafA/YrhL
VTPKIPVINGLRGVAILAVIVHHSFEATIIGGWLGVNLFLILSGFVLYLPFANGRPINAGDFYRRRFVRLAPLFYLIALVSIGFVGANYHQAIVLLSGLFTLSPRYFFPAANWVLWSLGVEFLLSLFFPALIPLLRRNVSLFLCATVALSVCTRLVGYSLGQRTYLDWISAGAIGRLDEFALGMVAAHLYAQGWRMPRPLLSILVGVALVGCAMVAFEHWRLGALPKPSAAILISIADVGFVLLLLGLLSRGSQVMSFAPLQVVGMMCYSLYVWHGILLHKFFPDILSNPYATLHLRYAAYIAVLFGLAAITYRFVEFRRVDDWRSLFLLHRDAQRRVAV